MIAPLKSSLCDYQAIEFRWACAVEIAAGLPADALGDPLVKAADRAAMVAEWTTRAGTAQLVGQGSVGWAEQLERASADDRGVSMLELASRLSLGRRPTFVEKLQEFRLLVAVGSVLH